MRLPLFAALLLSACSAEAADNAAAPVEAPPARAMPATTAAVPGIVKIFGDWAVGCDNTALCTMASLSSGAVMPEVTMALLRQPGPEGAIDLSFEVPGDGDAVQPVAITVDGRRIALPSLNGAPAARVVAAMANGRTLAIVEAGGMTRSTVSLAGASAALRWIDAAQGRSGTVTAIVARGARSATTVPEAGTAPLIRAIVPAGVATLPQTAQLAGMRRRTRCGASEAPAAYPLGGGATLVLLPCLPGAYNRSSAAFVLKDGKVAAAVADTPTGFTAADRPAAPAQIVNADWRDGVLTSFAKGRGLGDCGVRQSFVWDGTRLRLTDQAEMPDCRGNPDFIVTWRADVIRR